MKETHCSFKKLESKITVVKKVNDDLVKHWVQWNNSAENAKYSHQECVEVRGIPSSVNEKMVRKCLYIVLLFVILFWLRQM